jgi:ABC-2 type transport system permease protein
MRTLSFLLQKEFKQIFRNKSILGLIIAMPVIQLIVMPLAADFEIKNINISIVDHDHSTYSRGLIDKIIASGYFKLNDYSESFDESFEQFQTDHSDLVLEIPRDFEKSLVVENKGNLFLAVNAINGTNASVGSAYLSRIINEFNVNIRQEWMEPSKTNQVASIEVLSRNWFNPFLNYPFFMVPGILVSLVTMVGLYMCALNIVKEKEVGTIEQINVTPIKKHLFILGKLIPFWVIGMFVFSVGLLGVARLIYGIVSVGSLGLLYSYLALFLVAVLGVGLLISTYSQTQQQAMSLGFFIIMVFILMSGLFTSIDSMPEWAQWISKFNPVTYFIEVMRMVVLKGSGFNDIKTHFLAMIGFALFFNTWAVLNYSKTS